MTFGATILDAEGTRLTEDETAFFREADPFGFILFARNIADADQLMTLCDQMREAVGRDAPILIDQEGGRVQRLRPPLAREWEPPLDFSRRAGAAATEAMYLRYLITALELRSYGIDVNCAPMVDVPRPETHDFLTDRCYGTTPAEAAGLGRAVAMGLQAGGVLPVVKHVPGHGLATADSHHDLPVVTAPRETLDAVDFAPFKVLNDLPMAMTAHVVYEAIDERPATLSPRAVQVIRNDIGFDGLLMTDDISMKALEGSYSDITRGSLAAGCDVVLLCNATLAERAAVADAAGRMSSAAQERADRALALRDQAAEVDIQAVEEKLEALLHGRDDG
ncbi:beta-N-acetylhexosaminidase, putative [Pseudooceanicola batsensis HTCC2597]|uniref:beta-N-acetylhexosaminidase n=1 Tax=Pseudooceanicola batsensis (strain ATCC BAA-863 / DSM 15984 / KCTC 12145 / HTCC2597) TaxID=252305 RepID=A3TX70_PSEBH|nr:beta-N-acetylhexosaminidase [Pseudooceanicola batsensis]EAQ03430.1 beta-N-acetylhexosaminidase, putative [Pseudooceanicola batsensis HTCC2597]